MSICTRKQPDYKQLASPLVLFNDYIQRRSLSQTAVILNEIS